MPNSPPLSPVSPFHPENRIYKRMHPTDIFSFRFLCSLLVVDIIAMREDYLMYMDRGERRVFMSDLVDHYHRYGSGNNKKDGVGALYELMLRLIFEVLHGHISVNDIRRGTWYRSHHRESKHGIRIEKLYRRVKSCHVASKHLRNISWL
jgi:hypothetical protein